MLIAVVKDALSNGALTHYATWGLVIFVATFVGIAVWALTRSRKSVKHWSELPLHDGPAPMDPRNDTPPQSEASSDV